MVMGMSLLGKEAVRGFQSRDPEEMIIQAVFSGVGAGGEGEGWGARVTGEV